LKFLAESLAKPEADVPSTTRRANRAEVGWHRHRYPVNRDDLSIQVRDATDNFRSYLMENVKEVRYDQPSLMHRSRGCRRRISTMSSRI